MIYIYVLCLRLVAPLLDLDLGLAGDTRPAAEGHDGVVPGAALYVVSLPGLLPEQHDGHAGEDAGQQHVQAPALAQTLRVLVDLAEPAAHPAHACFAVSAAVAGILFPLRHCQVFVVLSCRSESSNISLV